MGLELVHVAYGQPALLALARVVAVAKAGEALAPVTVVVPSNHVGVTARRALATGDLGPITTRGTGIIGVTFLTPYRLAELLGAPELAAAQRRPLSTPLIAAALRRALRQQPGVFAPVAEHPATEEALVAAFAELADLSSGGLERLGATSARAADVVRLCGRARAALADRWYDEVDLVQAARSVLRRGSQPLDLGHVVVYLPQDLTRRAGALVGDVAGHYPATVLVGTTGQAAADTGVLRSVRRILAAVTAPPSRRPLGGAVDAPVDEGSASLAFAPSQSEHRWPVEPDATRIVTTSDADDEVRTAIRAVLDAARKGTALERMAILYTAEDPYARLVHEHVDAAGIPANGTAPQGLGASVLGRTLLDLLALRDTGYRRRAVLGLLAGAPVRTPTGRAAPLAVWERLSRDAAVVAGRDDWDRHLAHAADELDRRAETLDAEAPDEPSLDDAGEAAHDEHHRAARVVRYRRRAERARWLRSLVLELIDQLDSAAASAEAWRDRVAWIRQVAKGLLGPESFRDEWPHPERKAAERVEAALDRLAALDETDDPVPLDVFRRTLELELDADLGRVGRFGEGILLAPLSFAIGLDLDLVVVMGMSEGTLPARQRDDSLLPDAERLATGGELPLRRERGDRQRRQLHAALAAARHHLLSAPRGDLRASNEHVPSRWLDEIGRIVPVDEVPSFAFGVTHSPFPATDQEYRLHTPATSARDPIVAAGQLMREARGSDRFTRFDGNLAGQPIRSPLDDVVSATRLESWAVCPFAYLVRQVLRVDRAEDPADALWISPLDKGSLVHEVLERFLLAVLALPAREQPDPDTAWTSENHVLLGTIGREVCDDYEVRGLVGRPLFWRRDRARIVSRLDRLLHEDSARRRATRSRPIAAELAFGLPGSELAPVDVPLPDGRTLLFRGAADRIDLAEDGTLRVIDYKTGRPWDYRLLSEQNPDDRGTHLQLMVYGMAARAYLEQPAAPVVAEYWFVGDNPGLTHIGYPVTDDVVARVGTTLTTVVEGIERGVFPLHPPGNGNDPFVRCWYCNPDGLGVTDRRRDWERKRRDPALIAYAELAEPSGDA